MSSSLISRPSQTVITYRPQAQYPHDKHAQTSSVVRHSDDEYNGVVLAQIVITITTYVHHTPEQCHRLGWHMLKTVTLLVHPRSLAKCLHSGIYFILPHDHFEYLGDRQRNS